MVGHTVLVTRPIPAKGLELLTDRLGPDTVVRVEPWGRQATEAELIDAVPGVDGLLCMLTDPITRRVLEAADRCKVVTNYAVGTNNIDVAAATERRIPVTYTPGVLTEATADLAFALLCTAARRVCASDRQTRAGLFRGWSSAPPLGVDLYGQTLGIVGAGRIGQATARRAAGFRMPILYTHRSTKPEFERETGARRVELDVLLEQADFVSLHLPYSDAVHHLFGADQFRRMKKSAVFVNTARGALVDEAALVAALQEGEIFAAGLDVYEHEPELQAGLAELDNVTLLPHIGSATGPTRDAMALMAAEGLVTALEGGRPKALVNPELFQ